METKKLSKEERKELYNAQCNYYVNPDALVEDREILRLHKEGMAFLHSLSLPENYRIALEGYLSVLDNVRREIRIASKRAQQLE